MSLIVSNMNERLVFDNSLNAIREAKIPLQDAVLSQGFLRSEIAASTTKGNYHIPILENDTQNGAAFNTEKRLKLQDAFAVSSIGVFLAKPSSAIDATFRLFSYPNATQFPTGAASLQTLYNGDISGAVNNKIIVNQWDVSRHYYVPQTQNAVGVTAQTVFPIDEFDLATSGFYPVEPNLVHVGSKNLKWDLNLPAAFATLDANTRIVIIWRGVLVQNSTSVY